MCVGVPGENTCNLFPTHTVVLLLFLQSPSPELNNYLFFRNLGRKKETKQKVPSMMKINEMSAF